MLYVIYEYVIIMNTRCQQLAVSWAQSSDGNVYMYDVHTISF